MACLEVFIEGKDFPGCLQYVQRPWEPIGNLSWTTKSFRKGFRYMIQVPEMLWRLHQDTTTCKYFVKLIQGLVCQSCPAGYWPIFMEKLFLFIINKFTSFSSWSSKYNLPMRSVILKLWVGTVMQPGLPEMGRGKMQSHLFFSKACAGIFNS